MSDDTPTVRFDQPQDGPSGPGFGGPGDPGRPPAGPGQEPDDEKKSRRLVIVLSIVGGVLLIAVIILLVFLFARGSGNAKPTPSPTQTSASPSPSPSATTASPTPTPSKTTTPPPPSTAPAIGQFVVSTTSVQCPTTGSTAPLTFSWTSTNASTAFFGIDTNDASIAPYFTNLPPNGSTASFPDQATNNPFQFTCSNTSHVYTITVVGNGQKASKSVTVKASN